MLLIDKYNEKSLIVDWFAIKFVLILLLLFLPKEFLLDMKFFSEFTLCWNFNITKFAFINTIITKYYKFSIKVVLKKLLLFRHLTDSTLKLQP